MAALITTARAESALPPNITTGQIAGLPTLILAASHIVERWCNRKFAPVGYVAGVSTDATINYDEILGAQGERWERGEPAYIQLTGFPINSVSRVSSGRMPILTISNTATSVNQRATAQLTVVGDPDIGYTTTGLTLTAVASGVSTPNTLLWSSYATIQLLCNAINALGSGWSAQTTGQGGVPNYALYSPTELDGPYGAQGCLQSVGGVSLYVYGLDLSGYETDYAGGNIILAPPTAGAYAGFMAADWAYGGFGPSTSPMTWGGPFRVAYNAGFMQVPDAVQNAVAMLVKNYFWDQLIAENYKSEKIGDYQYELAIVDKCLPMNVLAQLTAYKDFRV